MKRRREEGKKGRREEEKKRRREEEKERKREREKERKRERERQEKKRKGTPHPYPQLRRNNIKNKEERDLHFQGLWRKDFKSLSQEDSTCCLLTSRPTVTLEVVRGCAALASHARATNHTTTSVETGSEL